MADRICTVEGCQREMLARGVCSPHYQRCSLGSMPWPAYVVLPRPSLPIAERALRRIERREPGECWPWTGSLSTNGYGQIEDLATDGTRRPRRAHRVVYEALVGPIPDGLDLDHTCHTRDRSCPGGDTCPHRACCNPAHLEPVTRSVNLKRGRNRWREKTHCPQGHAYDAENTRFYRGRRYCRTCQNTKHLKKKEHSNA